MEPRKYDQAGRLFAIVAALILADKRGLTKEQLFRVVEPYALDIKAGKSEDALEQQFTRDKNLLRNNGFVLEPERTDEGDKYSLVERDLIMPSGKHALRQLFEQEAQLRGLSLRVVAEVDSVQSVLPLVARGVANTVLPISALKSWPGKTPPYVARIYAPHIKNKFTVAVPTARPSTQLTRFGLQLLKKLVHQHYG